MTPPHSPLVLAAIPPLGALIEPLGEAPIEPLGTAPLGAAIPAAVDVGVLPTGMTRTVDVWGPEASGAEDEVGLATAAGEEAKALDARGGEAAEAPDAEGAEAEALGALGFASAAPPLAGAAGESTALPQLPTNCPSCFVPTFVTSGPGLGKNVSLPSTVVQPLPRLALKMSGRAEKATAGTGPVPLAIVMEAQFM